MKIWKITASSLTSQLCNLFLTIITNKLTHKLDSFKSNGEANFRKGFSTIDHLLAIRAITEKATENNVPLHIAFVDYQKAFDTGKYGFFLI